MEQRDRESILADLCSEDDEIRRLAVERATTLAPEQALGIFLERLGDPSWRVRKASIERLAASRDPGPVVAALVRALGDGENPGRRNAALEALIQCGSPAVPSLLEASHADDVDVRKQIVDALGGIGDARSVGRLSELLSDPDANVRGAAADALGLAGRPACGPVLVRTASEDPESLVRLSALRALDRLQVPVVTADLVGLLDDAILRPAVYALLGTSGDDEALDWLLKGLAESGRSGREAAMQALVALAARAEGSDLARVVERVRGAADQAGPALADAIERLEEAPLPRRLVLVQFLGLVGRPEAVGPLLEAGADEALASTVLDSLAGLGEALESPVDAAFERLSPDARRLAAEVLGRSRGALGERRLVAALASDDAELRAAAARALGRRGAAAALPALVDAVASAAGSELPDGALSPLEEAIVGVARDEAGAPRPDVARRALSLFSDALADAEESFRVVAARTMGELGGPEDADRLGFLLSDPSERVRRAAVESLGRIARGSPPEPLRLALADESPAVRIGAAAALAAAGGPLALEDLANLAVDEDERVRAAAVRDLGDCLARLGGAPAPPVVAALERALAEGGVVALCALESLGRLGGEEAVRLARGGLASPDLELVRAAVACLGRHLPAGQLSELVPLLSHAEWSVRAQVVESLAERGTENALPPLLQRLEVEEDEFVRTSLLGAISRLER